MSDEARFSLPEDEGDARFDDADADGATIGCAEIGKKIDGRGGRRDFVRCGKCNIKCYAAACGRCGAVRS